MRLNLKPGVAAYVLVPPSDDYSGVTIHARPALSEVIEDAKGDDSLLQFADEIAAMVEDEGGQITAESIRTRGRVGLIFAKAVAREVIEGWDGVEDPDGTPAPVTADRVDAFLDVPFIYNAFTEVYLGRWLTAQAEKNGSAPSLTGTSAAARNTARPAQGAAKSARKGNTVRKR